MTYNDSDSEMDWQPDSETEDEPERESFDMNLLSSCIDLGNIALKQVEGKDVIIVELTTINTSSNVMQLNHNLRQYSDGKGEYNKRRGVSCRVTGQFFKNEVLCFFTFSNGFFFLPFSFQALLDPEE